MERDGSSLPIRVRELDHIVLRTPDVERSLEFYCGVLGLEPERVDEWRRGEVPFPSVRVNAATVIDVFDAERTGTNVDHVCLTIEPTDMQALVDEARRAGAVEILAGPVPRWGAQGVATSVYLADPDGNLVELRHYG